MWMVVKVFLGCQEQRALLESLGLLEKLALRGFLGYLVCLDQKDWVAPREMGVQLASLEQWGLQAKQESGESKVSWDLLDLLVNLEILVNKDTQAQLASQVLGGRKVTLDFLASLALLVCLV